MGYGFVVKKNPFDFALEIFSGLDLVLHALGALVPKEHIGLGRIVLVRLHPSRYWLAGLACRPTPRTLPTFPDSISSPNSKLPLM